MAKRAFITRSKKSAGKFAIRADDGTEMDDLDDLTFDEDLDDLFVAKGYSKSMRPPGPIISRLAARLTGGFVIGGATAKLDRLVADVASEMRLTEDHARDLVLQSPQGKDLWEQKRLEELEAGRQLRRGNT